MSKRKFHTQQKNRKIHARELIIDDQQGTSFAGLSLIEKTASHLSVWSYAQKKLPVRACFIDRLTISSEYMPTNNKLTSVFQ